MGSKGLNEVRELQREREFHLLRVYEINVRLREISKAEELVISLEV